MAKGIRSKVKRRNRTEFRNTIGQEAENESMSIIQAKLQECIQKGQLNSFDRLSSQLQGASASSDNEIPSSPRDDDVNIDAMEMDVPVVSPGVAMSLGVSKKNEDNVPVKAKRKKSKPTLSAFSTSKPYMFARRKNAKKNDQSKQRKQKGSSKKKRNLCAF